MSHGILCKHCGWSESAHDDASGLDWETVLGGYSVSLHDCPCYEASDPQREERLREEEPLHEPPEIKNEGW